VLLLALFAFQSRGTERVGAVFGPVMVVWFAVIGCLGLATIAAQPGVLRALSPHHGLAFLVREGWASAAILGAVFLVVTGAEALYADMGQFGRPVIRRLWLFAVLPALLLCYFGQGALVLARPEEAAQPFFHLAPAWARLPLVALTTGATIIASQAVISGAFSLTSQAIQLGELPRLRVLHTSMRAEGQVYLPAVNWILCAATIGLVLGFGSSSRLAGAYGVAVSATMLATTLLAFRVSIERWRWSVAIAAAVSLGFLLVDGAFLGANLLKIRAGGWFPLVVAACLLVLMTTWRRGRELLARGLRADTEPLHLFLQRIAADPPQRIPGTAVFLTRPRASTPPILLRYLERFGVLHENVVVASVSIDATPTVRDEDRAHVVRLSEDLCVVRLHFGFMEHPDVPAALRACAAAGIGEHEPTYFVGRESAVPSRRPGMAAWREALFAFLERNASDVTSYFRLPTEDVIELGIRVEI
jgi:KUP system potassium uptake protein